MKYNLDLPQDFDAGSVSELEEIYLHELEGNPKIADLERRLEKEIRPAVESRRKPYLERAEFLDVCKWKSGQRLRLCGKNSPADVEIVTEAALGSTDPNVSLGSLKALRGVGIGRASTILHWFHPDPYPIKDWRALVALGLSETDAKNRTSGRDFWSEYTTFCREKANSLDVDMRALDRALWIYPEVEL